MKLNNNFVLRQIADTWVLIPTGDTMLDLNSIIKLNDSGAMLWEALEKGASSDDLVKVLTAEYDVSEAQAQQDVEAFLKVLLDVGCLEQ